MTMAMTTAIATAMGVDRFSAPGPAMMRTRKISSDAYATEERLSEAKMASPVDFDSRSCRACAVDNGSPSRARFST
jgi:hypothetical protein